MTRTDRLAELLERWEETTRSNPSATPRDLCGDCPEMLDEFCALLERLGRLPGLVADGVVATEPAGPGEWPEIEADRYRPLRFHAKGGLGVIFLAEDGELRRQVALKCMQTHGVVDDAARGRFVAEAELTGRLEHPGVVPVYGLGIDPHGRPYYAMRFIEGRTLDAAARAFHDATPADPGTRNVELRRLLRHFIAVCETAAYAHARGVVHRDIKPANVMLGPYGETLLVDWGLAKEVKTHDDAGPDGDAAMRRNDESDDATVTGQAKGSPAYMSPEQARGAWDGVGPASDVYSLGATLYVLLTGKKPYDGRTILEVLRRVREGRFAPPRSANPAVPKALEAVCLKAMAFRPEDRYAGAKELAADVERWLADEPVSAWREPWVMRARRWVSRHRTLVVGIGAALVVAAALLSYFLVRLDAQNRQLVAANESERAARATAERNLNRNLSNLEGMLRFAFLTKQAQALRREPGYAALLEELARQFDAFAAESPESERGRRVAGLAHYLRAVGDSAPGLPEGLDRHLARAAEFFAAELKERPGDEFAAWGLGATRAERGRRLAQAGRGDEARLELHAAYELLAAGAKPGGSISAQHALALAAAAIQLHELESAGRAPPAQALRERIEATLSLLARASKGSTTDAINRVLGAGAVASATGGDDASFFDAYGLLLAEATLRTQYADLLARQFNDRPGAITAYRAAATAAAVAAGAEPGDPAALELQAGALHRRGLLLLEQKEPAAAFAELEAAYRAIGAPARARPEAFDPALVERVVFDLGRVCLEELRRLDPADADARAHLRLVAAAGTTALDQWLADAAPRAFAANTVERLGRATRLRKDIDAFRAKADAAGP
jgi:tRNA A-37 threonylcarbamoyl transferase component Bud32